MLFLRKLFKLPTPIDLGWSDYNALEDENFSDEPHGKTWQDWHRTVKEMHPVKYWFAETFSDFIKYKLWYPIWVPMDRAYYWFVSHVIPSRRYHMLDLRQENGYRYGWQDVPEKMLYAMFNLLGEYLNKENPMKWYDSEESYNDPAIKEQIALINEAKEIYHWWTVGREEEALKIDELTSLWCRAKENTDKIGRELYWKELAELKKNRDAKEDEMVLRLMKIRRSLWT
jgi:hypothetical protein